MRVFVFDVSINVRWTHSFRNRIAQVRFWMSRTRLWKWLEARRLEKFKKSHRQSDWPPASFPDTFGYATTAKPRIVEPDFELSKAVEIALREGRKCITCGKEA